MNKKYFCKITIVAAGFIVIISLCLLVLSLWTTGSKVPLQNDDIAFGETEWIFRLKKGTPSKSEIINESESIIHTYDEEIFSLYQAKADYWFVKSDIFPFMSRLYMTEYSIEAKDKENINIEFDSIVEILKAEYDLEEGYYLDYNNDSSANLGFTKGAVGLSAAVSHNQDRIYVRIEYSF